MRRLVLRTLCALLCATSTLSAKQRLTDYVDPFIGSGGHGHVFVGACVPFGFVTTGPTQMTDGWDWCSGYHQSDNTIRGFGQLHLSGTGCADLGDVSLMPVVGDVRMQKGDTTDMQTGFYSTYSHDREYCEPGYYAVFLERYGVWARMTATQRVAFQQYVYPEGADARVVIDLENGIGWNKSTDCELRRLNDSTVVGHRFSRGWAPRRQLYFVIRFTRPMKRWQVSARDSVVAGDAIQSPRSYGLAYFDTSNDTVVGVKVALSAVSVENAMANLTTELPGSDFTQTRQAALQAWDDALNRIKATLSTERERRIFYTSLYHTMIHPTLYNDCNGDYRGMDGEVKQGADFQNYTTFSLWDTYRGTHPLFSLICPERQHDFVSSLVNASKEQGFLPIWPLMSSETGCMVGSPAVPVLADLCMKGFVDDIPTAYAAIKQSLGQSFRGLKYLNSIGYVPCDKVRESVSISLENYVAYAGAARVARLLGQTADAGRYDSLSRCYAKLYDATTGFFRGRRLDGSFRPGEFNPGYQTEDFTEGTPWQYLWLVPHDVAGLIRLVGGRETFETRLDSLFLASSDLGPNANPDISGLVGQYAHGNEPSHHVVYLYNYIGKQWRTVEWVRRILREFYADAPDGLCGNEDAGQMSAWYVLSAMGFYPVDPMGGCFVIGSPVVEEATLNVGNGRTFRVIVRGNDERHIYVKSVRLNGKPYDKTYIDFADIQRGGTLEFQMTDRPSDFGTDESTWPQNNPTVLR